MEVLEKRALYNLIRMNWLNDSSLPVETWQVEDYQTLSTSVLFERLKKLDISFDSSLFKGFSEDFDAPEDLAEHLIADRSLTASEEDQIYLLIFELWRRLLTGQPSISILCDHLDRQIYLYDQFPEESTRDLEESIRSFVQILQNNVDQGIDPSAILKRISSYFANDIETFFYDFISQKMEEENESYAEDLIECLAPYFQTNKWFLLLRLRFYIMFHNQIGKKSLQNILDEYLPEKDLEFNLEFLSILSSTDDTVTFYFVLEETFPLLTQEDHLQDLIEILADYYQMHKMSQQSKTLAAWNLKRKSKPLNAPISSQDREIAELRKMLFPSDE